MISLYALLIRWPEEKKLLGRPWCKLEKNMMYVDRAGHAVAQLVEALRYKPEERVTGIFNWHDPSSRTMALGLTEPQTEMNTRNISLGGAKGGWCMGLTTLPPSCADCLEIWESQTPGTLRGLYRDCITFTFRWTGLMWCENGVH